MTIIPWNGQTEEEVLTIAAAIDTHSTHPLAEAVTAAAKGEVFRSSPLRSADLALGRGAEAVSSAVTLTSLGIKDGP